MSELTLEVENHGVKRVFNVWRSGGEIHTQLQEREGEKTYHESTVSFALADDNKTVAHDGREWREYANARFERLNECRF